MRFFFSFVLIFSQFPPTCSWGKVGHEIVANIAWQRLSPQIQLFVKDILSTTNSTVGSPLAYVADWADRVRYTSHYHWTAPLHFVDIHDDEIDGGCPAIRNNETLTNCTFNYTRDCENDVCVAGAIANYSSHLLLATSSSTRLAGASSSWKLKEALMFVTHFIGDVHQPLHVARKSDKGGNTIHVHFNVSASLTHKKGEWNLHSVWDDGIIERALVEKYNHSRQEFEADLRNLIATSGSIDEWLSCSDGSNKTCTTVWAAESLKDALVWAYRNSDDSEVVEGSEIMTEYYESRLGVVQRKLAAAGVRLAATLQLVLGGGARTSFGELLFSFVRQAQL